MYSYWIVDSAVELEFAKSLIENLVTTIKADIIKLLPSRNLWENIFIFFLLKLVYNLACVYITCPSVWLATHSQRCSMLHYLRCVSVWRQDYQRCCTQLMQFFATFSKCVTRMWTTFTLKVHFFWYHCFFILRFLIFHFYFSAINYGQLLSAGVGFVWNRYFANKTFT